MRRLVLLAVAAAAVFASPASADPCVTLKCILESQGPDICGLECLISPPPPCTVDVGYCEGNCTVNVGYCAPGGHCVVNVGYCDDNDVVVGL